MFRGQFTSNNRQQGRYSRNFLRTSYDQNFSISAQWSIAPLKSEKIQILYCYFFKCLIRKFVLSYVLFVLCFYVTHYFLKFCPFCSLIKIWLKSASNINKMNQKHYKKMKLSPKFANISSKNLNSNIKQVFTCLNIFKIFWLNLAQNFWAIFLNKNYFTRFLL